MTIQVNTDNHIEGNERLQNYVQEVISNGLSRFSEQITRVEVHLNDENSHKEGQKDKRCMVETRLEGMQPIAVTSFADTHEQAVKGALDKMKSALDTAIGKLRTH